MAAMASIDWSATNLPEALGKFGRTCEYIFDGLLADRDEAFKAQYLMLWVGDDGRDTRDGWRLAVENKKLLAPHWKRCEDYVKPKFSFHVSRFYLRTLKQDSHDYMDAFMTRARLIANEYKYTDKEEQLQQQKPKVGLSAYGGTKVRQYGCFTLRCTHSDTALDIEFHVTEDTGLTMVGLQACKDLRLISLNCEHKSACYDCHGTSQVSSPKKEGDNPSYIGMNDDAKEHLFNKYPKCFRGLGLFSGEYHIDLKQEAKFVIHPPRRVPESLKDAGKNTYYRSRCAAWTKSRRDFNRLQIGGIVTTSCRRRETFCCSNL